MNILRHRNFSLLLILISFVLFFIIDLYIDLSEGVGADHIWHEFVFLFLAIGASFYQARSVFKIDRELEVTRNELLETKKSYKAWQTKSRTSAQELRRMIDQQFQEWGLSQSEKEIALFLIKGLSMKEIADLRKTSDTTVRQQASVIYKKSNTSGRQELSAFFLEDILAVDNSSF